MQVYDKINRLNLGPKPYFLPVYSNGSPIWKHPIILAAYTCMPNKIAKLPFDYDKTLIVSESGGNLRPGQRPETSTDCLRAQFRAMSDIGLTLDFPTKLRMSMDKQEKIEFLQSSDYERKKSLDKTIQCAEEAIQLKPQFESIFEHEMELMAVIQGWNLPSAIFCTNELASLDFNFYAFGLVSTVTSAATINQETILEELNWIRDIIGKKAWLHLLGTTNVNFLRLAKDLITSFDSARLSHYAAFGMALHEDGSIISLKRDITQRGKSKYIQEKVKSQELPVLCDREESSLLPIPSKGEDYRKIQEINYENFMKILNRTLWV